jgi:DNA sulfur modification protein DndE
VTNIDIKDVQMIGIKDQAILFDMHYQDELPIDKRGMVTRAADAEIPAVTDTTPRFRDISIRNVICRGADRAVLMAGLPEMLTQNIRLENVSITAKTGMLCMDARDIELKNVEILNEDGPALHFYNAQDVQVDGFGVAEGVGTAVRVQGTQNTDLTVSNLEPGAKETLQLVEGAEETSITIK